MRNENYLELLTAYVDGELPGRQRKAVARLLRRSPEARKLLADLQQDAQRLRRLPRHQLAPDFSAQVLHTIAVRKLRPGRLRPSRPLPLQVPAWVAVTVAASVLLLVTTTSYVYFARPTENNTGPSVARPGATPTGPSPKLNQDLEAAHLSAPRLDDKKPASQPKPKDQEKPPAESVAVKPKDRSDVPGRVPKPAADPDTTFGASTPVEHMEMFKAPDVALPAIFKLAELDHARLKDELKKDNGFRLELPCKEGARAFERLQAVLKGQGVGLLIDKVAQERLSRPQLRTNFVLYAEDLTADELVKVLQQLAAEERQRVARKAGDGQFDGLVVTRLGKDDWGELSKLLGVDPTRLHSTSTEGRQAGGARGPLGVNPSKPLSDQTADKVIEAVKNPGNKQAAKPAEHQALVLAYNPVRPRSGSAEVQKFLDSRKPRPDAVKLLLVLRETRG